MKSSDADYSAVLNLISYLASLIMLLVWEKLVSSAVNRTTLSMENSATIVGSMSTTSVSVGRVASIGVQIVGIKVSD